MFKNETHNHPTEIEPFGGASTCIGGAIRDPLTRTQLRLSGDARHRLRATFHEGHQRRHDSGAQAAAESRISKGAARTAILHTATRSALADDAMLREIYPSGLCRQAHGSRRGRRRGPEGGKRRAPVSGSPGDVVVLIGRRDRPRRRRRRDRLLQGTQFEILTDQSAPAEVQKGNAPDRAQAPAAVPQSARRPVMIKKCQRLRRRRRQRRRSANWGSNRAGTSTSISVPRRNMPGSSGTAGLGHHRISQERMAVARPGGGRSRGVPSAAPREENLGCLPSWRKSPRTAASGHEDPGRSDGRRSWPAAFLDTSGVRQACRTWRSPRRRARP